jgi:uncharacterized protein (UPF0216 family)
MPSPDHNGQTPITAEEVSHWLTTIQQKGKELDALAAASSQTSMCSPTMLEMTTLLHQGFEETRVISETLHAQSTMVREDAMELQRYTTQILAQCHKTMEQLEKYLPPAASERNTASPSCP